MQGLYKKKSKLIQKALFAILFFIVVAPPPLIFAQNDSDIIPGKYIVLLRQDESALGVAQSLGFTRTQTYEHVFSGMTISATEEQVAKLRDDPRVIAIEPDRVVWAFAQTLPAGIDRADADLNPFSKIDGVDERVDIDIAILDTGILKSHPDLNLHEFVNFAPGSTDDDRHGHGTHVAGITAAIDNDEGVVGMAPGARLWAIKVLGDSGQGSLSDIIKGIDYVTEHADEIEVANMSLGGEFTSAILDIAISNSVKAGVTYVVAAGNDGRDAVSFSPANHPQVITVSAMVDTDGKPGGQGPPTSHGGDDRFASFSNFGEVVDIAAPGVEVLSSHKNNGYAKLSGTSMASPHVAGAAALYIIQNGRDQNNDGAINENDVALIRDGLIKNGILQSDSDGFSGDPDSFAEPLVSAAAAPSGADFALSASPSSITMDANDSKNANVTVSPLNGFVGTVNLSVAVSSQEISASISPDSITIQPSDTQKTAVLTIISENTTGSFRVDVTGSNSDGSISHSDSVDVTVGGGGGCLIATAAYGSELAPQVQLLREIRNDVLGTSSGTRFMTAFNAMYYSFSPTVADWERNNPAFKDVVKTAITPMLWTMSVLTYADIDSEQEMIGYGLAVILLNIGMYFVGPALIVLCCKNRAKN